MHGLDIEEVRLAGKPPPSEHKKKGKTIRYPTEANTLQEAIDLCVSGDCVEISQGVYHENIVINVDLEIVGEVDKGDVVILSRHDTAVLVDRCSVKIVDVVMAVEEGALMHHALHVDHAQVELDNCEMYGGRYALFASDKSSVNALRSRFHAAYSFGATLLNSKGVFTDCYFFRNRDDGYNTCGACAHTKLSRCRIADNEGFGMHVHTGASVEIEACDILQNGQAGLAVTGGDEMAKDEEGIPKPSLAIVQNSRIMKNDWQGILVTDASLKCENNDLRRNTRHALTLSSSSLQVNNTLERTGEILDVEYYNTLDSTGMVELVGNQGVSDEGHIEISLASSLPPHFNTLPKEKVFELFQKCPLALQKRLTGHPDGWSEEVPKDTMARVKIVALWNKWATEEETTELSEVDMTVEDFLRPLGLSDLVWKLHECSCFKVADIMSMSNVDLLNLGLKSENDRKMILARLAANSGRMINPQHKKPLEFAALIEATRIQAKGDDMKELYTEWKKLRHIFADRFGTASGVELEAQVRALFHELDADDSAGIDEGELRVALQATFNVNIATVDVEKLMAEADKSEKPEGKMIDFDTFCQIVSTVLRT